MFEKHLMGCSLSRVITIFEICLKTAIASSAGLFIFHLFRLLRTVQKLFYGLILYLFGVCIAGAAGFDVPVTGGGISGFSEEALFSGMFDNVCIFSAIG